MGEEKDIQAKIEKFETYLNETLRRDLRLCLEERDRIYSEQADLLGMALPTFFSPVPVYQTAVGYRSLSFCRVGVWKRSEKEGRCEGKFKSGKKEGK
jgi:hypothetical protein